MLARHADLLFGLNELRSAVVRAGPAAGDWKAPSRGLAQGDPLSPLGAALYAAALAAVLAAEIPEVSFQTFVDDRTTLAYSVADFVRARDLVQQLDNLCGQLEDDGKLEVAFINAPDEAFQPNARRDHLDLLGMRFNLQGRRAPSLAPTALSRKAEVMKRLDQLHKVSRCLSLTKHELHRAIVATMGLLR